MKEVILLIIKEGFDLLDKVVQSPVFILIVIAALVMYGWLNFDQIKELVGLVK